MCKHFIMDHKIIFYQFLGKSFYISECYFISDWLKKKQQTLQYLAVIYTNFLSYNCNKVMTIKCRHRFSCYVSYVMLYLLNSTGLKSRPRSKKTNTWAVVHNPHAPSVGAMTSQVCPTLCCPLLPHT